MTGVEAADFALQLGEFFDQLCGQIGLAESGGHGKGFEVDDQVALFDERAKFAGESSDALGFLGVAA